MKSSSLKSSSLKKFGPKKFEPQKFEPKKFESNKFKPKTFESDKFELKKFEPKDASLSETRMELWLGNGCSGYRNLSRNTNVFCGLVLEEAGKVESRGSSVDVRYCSRSLKPVDPLLDSFSVKMQSTHAAVFFT